MRRRRLLGTVGAVSTSVAGCLGPNMPKDAVVRAVQKSVPADVTPVAADDLPEAERRIARTAVEESVYHACPELPDAVRSFAGRFEGVDDAYLSYQNTNYDLWIRIQDQVFAMTASSPDNDPSCRLI